MAIIGYHIVLTGYGHWLPNDPRGSMSETIHAPDLSKLGEIHFGRRSVQPTREQLREFYEQAQQRLHYPVLWWNDSNRRVLARAFGDAIGSAGLTCYACAVLSNHAHLLIRRHRLKAEQMIDALKQAGRRHVVAEGLSVPEHPVFSADPCHVYKDSVAEMRSCVEYIRSNYPKHRIAPIECPWVAPYDGWPFHKRLKHG